MPFIRIIISIASLVLLLSACFYEGPTIHNNDQQGEIPSETSKSSSTSLPTITAGIPDNPDLIVSESQQTVVFVLTMSEPLDEDIVIAYQASGVAGVQNSATRQDDFLVFSQSRNASADTVTMEAGSTQTTFTINIKADTIDEDDEIFAVNIKLNIPSDVEPMAEVLTKQLIVTIADDDALPIIELYSERGSIFSAKESEGAIQLQLRMPYTQSNKNVIVPVSFIPESSQPASPQDDYIPFDSLVFPAFVGDNPEAKIYRFELLIHDDAVKEGNEKFYFRLGNPLNGDATLGTGPVQLTITIEDDDAIGGINDTQVEKCSDGISPAVECPVDGYPNQDGQTNISNNYQFLNNDGDVVTSPGDAVCVEDLTTGLVWEIKTVDVTDSPRNNINEFTWWSTLDNVNGGYAGQAGSNNSCLQTIDDCSTKTYLASLNEGSGLCANTSWRIPKLHELVSIMSFKSFPDPNNTVMVDRYYFPNTKEGYYWTATPVSGFQSEAWAVYFGKTPLRLPGTEFAIPYSKIDSIFIRAVANRK